MSLTNFISPSSDKKKLFEICKKLFMTGACRGIMSKQSSKSESYYCNRSELRLFDLKLFDYDFNTPAELRNILEKMWEYQECEYMKEFAVVATIAAFHNKKERSVETKAEISAFIYNF